MSGFRSSAERAPTALRAQPTAAEDRRQPTAAERPGPWAALLPTLDPTTMGWRGRTFYLDPNHTAYLFDSVGNAVPTVWVNGRIVGGWSQDQEGEVRIMLREKLTRRHLDLVEEARQRLAEFVEGDRVPSTYAAALLDGRRLP